MANDPRPSLTPVETPCGQAMARNAGGMALSMICIQVYTVTRQARKFNPALQETTSNAWDLPGRVTPDMGQITQVSSMAQVLATFDLGHCFGHDWSLLDLKLSSFLLGLFILSHSQMTHGV